MNKQQERKLMEIIVTLINVDKDEKALELLEIFPNKEAAILRQLRSSFKL